MAGFDDFRKPLDPEPTMRRWAEATQRRNLESLAAAQGPGGPPLAPNQPSTVKRKGHDRVGFHTGEMAAGLVAPDAVNLRIGSGGAEAEVFAGPGNTDKKVNIFISGQGSGTQWRSERTKSGKRRAWRVPRDPVPPRDFIGLDERDLEKAGEDALDTVLKTWGFS